MRRRNSFKSLKNQNVRKSAEIRNLRTAQGAEQTVRRRKRPRLQLAPQRRTGPKSGRSKQTITGIRAQFRPRADDGIPLGNPPTAALDRTRSSCLHRRRRRKNRQLACKPGSVWPRHPRATERGSHSSGTALARSLLQPTRMTGPETGWALARPRHPYSVLLPVGFAVPSMSPCPRWALTPPFHPYSASGAVCFLWHFP